MEATQADDVHNSLVKRARGGAWRCAADAPVENGYDEEACNTFRILRSQRWKGLV